MKPLTIEQLKVLEVDDWVWTVYLRTDTKQYHCIAKNEDNRLLVRDKICFLDLVELNYSDYGTKWLAYRNKQEAEAKGEIVELPKFGDTYWYIYSGGVPEAVVVTRLEVEINQNETRIYAYGRACGGLVGVIMFSTYEQAEARLKELQEKK